MVRSNMGSSGAAPQTAKTSSRPPQGPQGIHLGHGVRRVKSSCVRLMRICINRTQQHGSVGRRGRSWSWGEKRRHQGVKLRMKKGEKKSEKNAWLTCTAAQPRHDADSRGNRCRAAVAQIQLSHVATLHGEQEKKMNIKRSS